MAEAIPATDDASDQSRAALSSGARNRRGPAGLPDRLLGSRIGFGTLQLPGQGYSGRRRETAVAVLGAVTELGVDHIETAQFYGPDVAPADAARRESPGSGDDHSPVRWRS